MNANGDVSPKKSLELKFAEYVEDFSAEKLLEFLAMFDIRQGQEAPGALQFTRNIRAYKDEEFIEQLVCSAVDTPMRQNTYQGVYVVMHILAFAPTVPTWSLQALDLFGRMLPETADLIFQTVADYRSPESTSESDSFANRYADHWSISWLTHAYEAVQPASNP